MSAAKKAARPRMGRPPLAEGTAKTGVFTLRLSDQERAELTAAAERAGLPLTQWARETLLAAARA